jgi:hypothetical protein
VVDVVCVMSFHDVREQLGRLEAERLAAVDAGLDSNAAYMRELGDELIAARAAYVGLGVTAIASLRGELFGAQLG